MSAEVVPGAVSMPRRARYLIPEQLPRRGEVMAAFAVLVLLAHLLFAQLTFVLAIVFTVTSRASRWRLWWLTLPAAAGLGWTLATGPRSAAAGFTAGPARILGYFGGGHPLDRLLHPHGAFAGAGGWLPLQLPIALIAAAAEAALIGWLDWVHTDEWAVPPRRPGALAAVRGALASQVIRTGSVVTRDGCALGVAPASGARVVLGRSEIAGGVLVTGADARALALSSLQVVHAALRRRKPLIAVDLGGAAALDAVLGAACGATGTPLRAIGEPQARRLLIEGGDGAGLGRVVRDRSAVLLSVHTPDLTASVCADILALGEDLREIGVDGDALVWLYGYEAPPAGPVAGLVASLVAGGAAAGLPVLVTTTSRRAAADLARLVSVVLVHQLADAATARILAARTGTRLVPARVPAGEQPTALPQAGLLPQGGSTAQAGPGQQAAILQQAGLPQQAPSPHPAASALQAGLLQPALPPHEALSPLQAAPPLQAASTQQAVAFAQQAVAFAQASSVQQPGPGQQPVIMEHATAAAMPGSGLVPRPAVPARSLLSLGPAEFVLAVSAPAYRLVELGRAVPARLPRGGAP